MVKDMDSVLNSDEIDVTYRTVAMSRIDIESAAVFAIPVIMVPKTERTVTILSVNIFRKVFYISLQTVNIFIVNYHCTVKTGYLIHEGGDALRTTIPITNIPMDIDNTATPRHLVYVKYVFIFLAVHIIPFW